MPAVINYGKASNRKNMAARRQRIGDGVTLATPDGALVNFRRVDGTFVLNPPNCEIAGMVEDDFYSESVHYIKNTSGGSWTKGILLTSSTSYTASGSVTAPNVSAGSSVVVVLPSVTGTIEVGSFVSMTDSVSPNDVQYSLCTAKSGTSYTFDEIKYDMTTPSIVVIPVMIPTAATNASGGDCQWVVTATIATGSYGWVYGAARVTGIDTSSYSAVGSKVYLGTAGAATPTAPSSATTTVQRVGVVEVKDATVGVIRFYPHNRIIEKIGVTVLPSLTSAHLFVGSSSSVATDVAMSGDIALTATGATSISPGVIVNADINASAAIDFSKLAFLASGSILVGSAGNVATSTVMSGDATLNSTGVLTIATSAITNTKLATSAVTNAKVDAAAAIAFSKLASLTSASLLVGSSTNVPTAVAMTGDIGIDSTGATSIAAGAIVNADVNASAAIVYSKLSLTGSIVNADIATGAAIAYTKLASLTSANLIVGSTTAVPTAVALSGDATIISTGAMTIATSAITNSKVAATAAIDFSKLAVLPSTNILVGSAGSVATAVAMSSDATLSNTGALTIATSAITNSKLATSAVTNAKVDAAAAIDFSKLAALTTGNILIGSAGNVATALAVGTQGQILGVNSTPTVAWQYAMTKQAKTAAYTAVTADAGSLIRTTGNSFGSISNMVLSSNVVTVTCANSFVSGQYVNVQTTTAAFLTCNGTFPIASIVGGGTGFTYALTAGNIGTAAAAGFSYSVTMVVLPKVSTVGSGFTIWVENYDGGAALTGIASNATTPDTISGANCSIVSNATSKNIILTRQYAKMGFMADATNNDWSVIECIGDQVTSGAVTIVNQSVNTGVNITSIPLTPGDWDVGGIVQWVSGGTTVTAINGSTSTTSATLGTAGDNYIAVATGSVVSGAVGLAIPAWRVVVTTTQTVYLVAQLNAASGTNVSLSGRLSARRIR